MFFGFGGVCSVVSASIVDGIVGMEGLWRWAAAIGVAVDECRRSMVS